MDVVTSSPWPRRFFAGAAVLVPLIVLGSFAQQALYAALSPWTTLAEVARAHVPFGLSGLFLRERYDSLAAAGRVHVPALVVHGRYDTIIPFGHGQRLAAALPAATTRFVAVESGHNDLFAQEVVWRELGAFVDRVAAGGGSAPDAEPRAPSPPRR